tara:strand:+ start:11538 stop:11741 length:204 start_codon:yes stop_codon:yes gene_type:complete
MKDSQEQGSVMVKLTEGQAATLLKALGCAIDSDTIPRDEANQSLYRRLRKDRETLRAIRKGNAKGWY